MKEMLVKKMTKSLLYVDYNCIIYTITIFNNRGDLFGG